MAKFGKLLLALNKRPVPPPPLMCFATMTGVPLPFGKNLCGLLRLQKWGISGMWGMERV
jgi:hypothetical protein